MMFCLGVVTVNLSPLGNEFLVRQLVDAAYHGRALFLVLKYRRNKTKGENVTQKEREIRERGGEGDMI